MSVRPWLSPGALRPGARAALTAASWLTSPLSPDDYLGLLDPLWSARHPAGRVSAVRREATGAATLVIRPGRGWGGHRAGQYLPLGVEIDGVRHWRTYSITSPPGDGPGDGPGGEITVTVKARPDGRVSPHLVHRTPPGAVLRLGPAQGEFVLPRPLPGRLLFVTAGSGITPVVGMLRTLVRHGGAAPDTLLLHSAPSPAECLFRAELVALERRLPWLGVRLTHTRTEGRLTAERIGELCPDWRRRETWACGPAGLLDVAERQWAAAGVRERLRVERFHLAPVRAPGADAVGGRVRFDRSAVEADATAASSLLAVGESAGVPMPHGCRRGLCFGCLVPLVDGRVRDLRTGELRGEPGELIQTCVNGAAGPLVLDL
ncbi:ferredoxin reductase [Streptomyces atriruber]|uniref:ferredoxin reductase n=1 Tax=Streptomyces atriruber TaxID=545121 RepID=UPI00099ED44C|nr:ferredoxin reductase [Streptomyces atriruber]